MRIASRFIVSITALLTIGSCTPIPQPGDADVIIVGAGIAGLSAALEASAEGATVLVLDANSVGGGHAVKAGGFALVDTQLQRDKGINDSPDLAWGDLVRWGVDPDPYWTRLYAEQSGTDVYDWLTSMGVRFSIVMKTPEHSVPRFHFTSGTAVNAVVPMLRTALLDPHISFRWNTRVIALQRSAEHINGVVAEDTRTDERVELRSGAVVLATGGFQNNLTMVRENWSTGKAPEQLLKGAGHFATGDGYHMAEWAGANMVRMTDQVTFYTGVTNPRDASGETAFHAQNPAAIWLDLQGRRFVNESADSKTVAAAVTELDPMSFWMVFDSAGLRKFSLRGAPWLNKDTIRAEFLDNPEITRTADNLEDMAHAMGLPVHNLRAAVQVWNRMFATGTDVQFSRFNSVRRPTGLRPVTEPPFYAVRVHPLTRKSMGGPAINVRGQVVNNERQPVPGLYAAGELTGVAGINGSHGGSGTFLGPSVLIGRIAGRHAAIDSGRTTTFKRSPVIAADESNRNPGQPGYWHFDAVHRTVSERGDGCEQCHSEQMPMTQAT
jgi:flavocytochrome c